MAFDESFVGLDGILKPRSLVVVNFETFCLYAANFTLSEFFAQNEFPLQAGVYRTTEIFLRIDVCILPFFSKFWVIKYTE